MSIDSTTPTSLKTVDITGMTIGGYRFIERICHTPGGYRYVEGYNDQYPCTHTAFDITANKVCKIRGAKIYELLKANGLEDPHFARYAKWANPTTEETSERELRKQQSEEQSRLAAEKRECEQKVVDTYKASTHIERLKSRTFEATEATA